jgi:hypothetical protein
MYEQDDRAYWDVCCHGEFCLLSEVVTSYAPMSISSQNEVVHEVADVIVYASLLIDRIAQDTLSIYSTRYVKRICKESCSMNKQYAKSLYSHEE